MTNAIVIVLTYVAVLAAGTGPAAAQARPWCFYDTSSTSGGPINCGFHSFEQCQAARAGGSSHCVPNPAFAGGSPSTDGRETTPRERRR